MFAKIKAFFQGLFANFSVSPQVKSVLAGAASAVATELGAVAMNVLLAKAGQLSANADLKYVGKDGQVKLNAVRDELTAFAKSQGIPIAVSTLNWIIESVHKAAQAPVA